MIETRRRHSPSGHDEAVSGEALLLQQKNDHARLA